MSVSADIDLDIRRVDGYRGPSRSAWQTLPRNGDTPSAASRSITVVDNKQTSQHLSTRRSKTFPRLLSFIGLAQIDDLVVVTHRDTGRAIHRLLFRDEWDETPRHCELGEAFRTLHTTQLRGCANMLWLLSDSISNLPLYALAATVCYTRPTHSCPKSHNMILDPSTRGPPLTPGPLEQLA